MPRLLPKYFFRGFKSRKLPRIVSMLENVILESRLCPIFKAIVAGFRGKVALKKRTQKAFQEGKW